MEKIGRREFLKKASTGAIGIGIGTMFGCSMDPIARFACNGNGLEVGEGVVDITPPYGIEIAGFHRKPGDERRVTGVRHPAVTRALVVRLKDLHAAIVSLELCGISRDFAGRVQKRIAAKLRIPAENVRICATHTHSMPMLRYMRQWGATMPPHPYIDSVEDNIVESVRLAKEDLAPADLYLGKANVTGGNSNRTTKVWKTDKVFTRHSTDADRWLDTMLHCLHFRRNQPKRSLLWYHFSAHPVCFMDEMAGPDWPGIVEDMAKEKDALAPVFLQGHCGDVNPGDGTPWRGDPKETSDAVYTALHYAINHAEPVEVDRIGLVSTNIKIPLDIKTLKEQLTQYRQAPSTCTGPTWVDDGFAKDWFEGMSKWDFNKTSYAAPVSAIRLGRIGILFHPAELYSFYGLDIRRDSPFEDTLVVGFTDDLIGYLPDPNAYQQHNYEATTVPKILDMPPFQPDAASRFTAEAKKLLHKLA